MNKLGDKLKVICLGDSITYGVGDYYGGYTYRLRQKLEQNINKFGYAFADVYNLGINGDTLAGLHHRIDREIAPRIFDSDTELKELYYIVLIGANDYLNQTPLNIFQNELARLMREFDLYRPPLYCRVAFIQILPIYHNQREVKLADYNMVLLDEVSKASGIDFLPIALPEDFICEDGLHPNIKGHTLLCEYVYDYIIRKHDERIVILDENLRNNSKVQM